MRQDGLFMPRLQSSRIALSEFGATMELRLVRAACLRGELAGRSWPWYDVLTVENVACPGGLKSFGFNKGKHHETHRRQSSNSRIRNPLSGSHSGRAANEWRVVQWSHSARHQIRIGSLCPGQCVHCVGDWRGGSRSREKDKSGKGTNLKKKVSRVRSRQSR